MVCVCVCVCVLGGGGGGGDMVCFCKAPRPNENRRDGLHIKIYDVRDDAHREGGDGGGRLDLTWSPEQLPPIRQAHSKRSVLACAADMMLPCKAHSTSGAKECYLR